MKSTMLELSFGFRRTERKGAADPQSPVEFLSAQSAQVFSPLLAGQLHALQNIRDWLSQGASGKGNTLPVAMV
jgi:hypothetical protein